MVLLRITAITSGIRELPPLVPLRLLFTSPVWVSLYSLGLAVQPPWYKDHLAIKTTFTYSQRWSLYQGSTVYIFRHPNQIRK